MQLMARDVALIRFVGRFGQADAGHIREAIFQDISSDTPYYRRIKELKRSDYIRKVGKRGIRGEGRGTGRDVFQLGAEGWRVCRKRKTYKQPYRAVNDHTMAILDAYTAVKRLELEGRYKIHLLATELDSAHVRVDDVMLTSDLYLEVRDTKPGMEADYLWFLEIDRGSEGREAIQDKLRRYIYAWRHSGYELDNQGNPTGRTFGLVPFPLVSFVEEEADKLPPIQRYIREYIPEPADDGGEDPMDIFRLMSLDEFPAPLLP